MVSITRVQITKYTYSGFLLEILVSEVSFLFKTKIKGIVNCNGCFSKRETRKELPRKDKGNRVLLLRRAS